MFLYGPGWPLRLQTCWAFSTKTRTALPSTRRHFPYSTQLQVSSFHKMILLLTGLQVQQDLWKCGLHGFQEDKGWHRFRPGVRDCPGEGRARQRGLCPGPLSPVPRAELCGRQGRSLQQRRILQAMRQEFCLHFALLQLELGENIGPCSVFLL